MISIPEIKCDVTDNDGCIIFDEIIFDLLYNCNDNGESAAVSSLFSSINKNYSRYVYLFDLTHSHCYHIHLHLNFIY